MLVIVDPTLTIIVDAALSTFDVRSFQTVDLIGGRLIPYLFEEYLVIIMLIHNIGVG